jgi:hypothetical protein
MYQLFHEGEASESVGKLKLPKDLRKLLAKMEPDERNLLLHMAQKVARRSNSTADPPLP